MAPSRNLALILAIAFAVCGWIGSSSGSLAFAAMTERDHVLAVSLGDGHLDLVREHATSSSGRDVAQPIDPDHVVHLCHSLDAASSRPQAGGSGGADAAVPTDTQGVSFVPSRIPATTPPPLDTGSPPLHPTVLLL